MTTGGEDGPSRIDPTLRERIEAEFALLTAAFDAADGNPTPSHLRRLREAADRTMRAVAGLRLAVERMSSPDRSPDR